jgi:CTP synthase (UTP-ammonia lyase)
VTTLHVGLVGDESPDVRAHRAIPLALAHASPAGVAVSHEWLPTASLDLPADALARRLERFDGLWCVPGSPYASFAGALAAIRYAREHGVPFLGTCGGFQHAVIEHARNVLGMADAEHAETSPGAANAIITPLACSLVGVTGQIRFHPGSRVTGFYGAPESVERFHCSYGVEPGFRSVLEGSRLKVTAVDEEGSVRVVELAGHPFFMATLFQPELSSWPERPAPVVAGFIAGMVAGAAAARSQGATVA